jgi:hypothetical protein
MSLKYRLENKQSKIDGKGASTIQQIPTRKKVGDLAGEIISPRKARKRFSLGSIQN